MDPLRCVLSGIPQSQSTVVVFFIITIVCFVLAFFASKGTLKLAAIQSLVDIEIPIEAQKKYAAPVFAGLGIVALLIAIGVPWASGPCSPTKATITPTTVPTLSAGNVTEGRSQACLGSGMPVFDFEASSVKDATSCFGTPDIAWSQSTPATVQVAQGSAKLAAIPSGDVSAGWDSITFEKLRGYHYAQGSLHVNAGQMLALLTHSGRHVKIQVTQIGGLIDPFYSGLTYTFRYAVYP